LTKITDNVSEDFEDFFENSLCGYVTASAEGIIIRANARMAGWLACDMEALKGKRFSDVLTIGGKIYYETHLWPLLRMQGFFDEVALELSGTNNVKLQVLVNAFERRNGEGEPQLIRFTIFKASDRRVYEQNLKDAKAAAETNLSNALHLSVLREQFIAILGHDLRNPLGTIVAGIGALSRTVTNPAESKIIAVLGKSAARMTELISNIMDFARTRLGEGIVLDRQPVLLEPFLQHIVDEIKAIWPDRVIETSFALDKPVDCDPSRMTQLLSNLLANALTHGAANAVVSVSAHFTGGEFELAVCNSGNPIPAEHLEHLFEPFYRESSHRSQNGLGLGLYIASQISHAHNGQLTATSTTEQTCFTFRMAG
jgi:phosphoserine phosphatase RsbU/P